MNALVIVDLQYDFMPGGALAVAEGNTIASVIKNVRNKFDFVIFTQDWHPANHCSFRENGGIWPVHCVQGSNGAKIDDSILHPDDIIIKKGTFQDVDSYSGFWDNQRIHKTELDSLLRTNNVDSLYICGIATDYCVKFTALDAIDLRYKVYLIKDACRGVDVKPGDSADAVDEMKNKGVAIIESGSIA